MRTRRKNGNGFEGWCYKGLHELKGPNKIVRKDNSIRCRACQLRSQRDCKYGEGAGDYFELKYSEQSGKCALCNKYFDVLCLDHNHETGQWRGLVCKFCNLLIGWVESRKEQIERAEDYLSAYEG